MTTYIYALTDTDGTPRYVGKSSDPRARFVQHISGGALPEIRRWVRELRGRCEIPRLCVLYKVGADECPFKEEARFIRAMRTVGPLLNKLPREKRGRVLPGDGIKRCTVCNTPGHNRQTCPQEKVA